MGFVCIQSASCNAWRRPTLPGLEPQYHRRRLVSRPSSGWDRVGHRRYGHQAMKLALWVSIGAVHVCAFHLRNASTNNLDDDIWLEVITTFADAGVCSSAVIDGGTRFFRSIQARSEQLGPVSSMRYRTSTSGLSRSWSTTARRNLILREASRLDAFSGYPVHT